MAELNEVAEDEATREGAPKANDFAEGDLMSIVPVFKDDVDSDEEEVRLRHHARGLRQCGRRGLVAGLQ
jgi:hypothetical protein